MRHRTDYTSAAGCKHPASELFALGNGEMGCGECVHVARRRDGQRPRYTAPRLAKVVEGGYPPTGVPEVVAPEPTLAHWAVLPEAPNCSRCGHPAHSGECGEGRGLCAVPCPCGAEETA